MIVPVPRRRQHYISTLQRELFAFNGSEAVAFYNEAAGVRNVSVCWGGFARIHQLQATVDSVRCMWSFWRVFVNILYTLG